MTKDKDARREALRQVYDEALLIRLATQAESVEVRSDATYFLRNQEVVRQILLNDKAWHVRAAAAFVCIDASSLAAVACKDKDPRVRAIATGRLRDRALLQSIAEKDSDPRVRAQAHRGLPPPFAEAREVPIPMYTETKSNKE